MNYRTGKPREHKPRVVPFQANALKIQINKLKAEMARPAWIRNRIAQIQAELDSLSN